MGTLRSPRPWVWLTLLGLAALVLTGIFAYLVPVAHSRDAAALQAFSELDRPRTATAWSRLRSLCDPGSYALLGGVLLLVALLRRRPRTAGAVAFLLVATGLTTQTLKPLLAAPRYDEWLGYAPIGAGSWPSGHSTAAMTLALCLVLVAPRRLRPTAGVLGAAFALVIGVSNVVLAVHWPSDVVGGYLVAGTWTVAVLGVLAWAERGHPSAEGRADAREQALGPLPRRDVVVPVIAALGELALVAGIVAARAGQATDFAMSHPTALLVGSVIAGLAMLLPLALSRGTT